MISKPKHIETEFLEDISKREILGGNKTFCNGQKQYGGGMNV
jgi:hypothetical protein